MIKLGASTKDRGSPLVYGKKWKHRAFPNLEAIQIAADSNQVDLIKKLSKILHPPFYFLYVLLVSRCGIQPGRYQSEPIYGIAELEMFLGKYADYLEKDGRHNFWIGETSGDRWVVYDRHNFIYCYGNPEPFLDIVSEAGYIESEFSLNAPHSHYYHKEFDEDEVSILKDLQWDRFPLQDNDGEPV